MKKLIGIVLVLLVCESAHGANPFDLFAGFLNRNKTVQTQMGKVVAVERTISQFAYPIKFTIEGKLPQGQVDLFAMVSYGKDQVALAIPATQNPFGNPPVWHPDFFQWFFSDRLVAFKTTTQAGNKLVFDGYATVSKEYFEIFKITSFLFAVAPVGEVQKWNLANAHIIKVVLK